MLCEDKIQGREDYGDGVTRMSLDDWSCVSQYMTKARALRSLHLENLHFGSQEVLILSAALKGVKLKALCLLALEIEDDENESLGPLFASMNASQLETIDVVGCGAGVNACQGLASILDNEESELDVLNLSCNAAIDDECVEVLCRSLAKNTSLDEIHLSDNADDVDITDEGWALFDELVFDKSSLERIYRSNHTLRAVMGHPRPALFRHNSSKTGHEKILDYLMESGDFNAEPFVEYKVEMMPYVLGFFAHRNRFRRNMWHYLYQIVRRWNVPELFSFPSAEKVRLAAKMEELQGQMELLRSENARLSSENDRLLLEVQSSGKEKESSKRKRPK